MEEAKVDLRLKPGREKPVLNRHPWIFSGAIDELSNPNLEDGELVNVIDSHGRWLALAYFNPNSQISGRIISWNKSDKVNRNFWKHRLSQAISRRKKLQLDDFTTAFRLVNGEADLLPGLVVDIYGGFLVVQCLSLGIDRRKVELIDILDELLDPIGIIERSDSPIRKREGLDKVVGMRRGQEPPEHLVVLENGIKLYVDLYRGHKTGLYLDQRENRMAICQASNVNQQKILNVFSYTGAFAIHALNAGASTVINVESSGEILNMCRSNLVLNGYDRPSKEFIQGDAFHVLRQFREANKRFDMVILDPPKFAHSRGDVAAACRGYKDLNMIAMQLLNERGLIATFSCSGHISADLFQKVLFGASIDAGRDVQILRQFGQASDHPILLSFPESAYLKGFLCQAI
jgi:23S rRNA (cytosine1962-C5)-methyltransferase